MTEISQAKILIIATNGFEQAELEVPRDKLKQAGAKVTIASPDGKEIMGWDKKDWGRPAEVDLKIADAKCADYDALVIPGGVINPDKMRMDKDAVALVKDFVKSGKIVAAVCHGPWMLVEADCLRGRKATSWPSLHTDMKNAGADWVDQEVVTDKGIVTSRKPDDLPAFVKKIIEEVKEGRHQRRAA